MLTATVHALEGFFVEQTSESVLSCHTLHETHDEHVVVYGKVCLFVYRSKLKLVWRNLVVASLAGDTKFKCLNLHVTHEILYTFRN